MLVNVILVVDEFIWAGPNANFTSVELEMVYNYQPYLDGHDLGSTAFSPQEQGEQGPELRLERPERRPVALQQPAMELTR